MNDFWSDISQKNLLRIGQKQYTKLPIIPLKIMKQIHAAI